MSLLSEMVERHSRMAILGTSRTIEKIAENMAEELLREPAVRAKMLALIGTAVEQALTELQEEPGGER
jgi:hypothetical protein